MSLSSLEFDDFPGLNRPDRYTTPALSMNQNDYFIAVPKNKYSITTMSNLYHIKTVFKQYLKKGGEEMSKLNRA
jgi:hypothetical protein